MRSTVILAASLAAIANGHIGAYHKGMYCRGGPDGLNNNDGKTSTPLYNLSKAEWWFHAIDNCTNVPPKSGDWLDLPVGGTFTVEMANNQAFTTLSYGGALATQWTDGDAHPTGLHPDPGQTCITGPNIHTEDYAHVAGTAFAISYVSDIKDVTPENLVVFSVNTKTPWERIANFKVPKDLPPCPPGGCTCAWGWVPNGCGQANMYMLGYKCRVIGSKSTKKLAKAKPPVWCEGNAPGCVKGAKQMLYWRQAEGNNIVVDGVDLEGKWKSPAYNSKCGFADGAQNDIFV